MADKKWQQNREQRHKGGLDGKSRLCTHTTANPTGLSTGYSAGASEGGTPWVQGQDK